MERPAPTPLRLPPSRDTPPPSPALLAELIASASVSDLSLEGYVEWLIDRIGGAR